MCGIVGVKSTSTELTQTGFEKICSTLEHRGPDSSGIYIDLESGFALGHKRLTIIDLSSEADQPMESQDTSLSIVYNGEIYNYRQVRIDLESLGHSFRTNSDTEVVLEAYIEWGNRCVDRFEGMFAFGILDKKVGRLFLARDRLGIKPLVYYFNKGTFIFASEIKTILEYPKVDKSKDETAIYDYFTYGYIPAPKTPYFYIKKLEPAHTLIYQENNLHLHKYWNLEINEDFINMSEENLLASVTEELFASVKKHLVSDVPVGAFLSGGMDSGTIVSIASQLSSQPVKTFTVDFNQPDDGEAENAMSLSKRYRTDHHVISIEQYGKEDISTLWNILDEPLGDFSILPTLLVARFASEHVKVALSGDGGDELFGGYLRYNSWMKRQWVDRLPSSITSLCGSLVDLSPKNTNPIRRWGTYANSSPLERYCRLVTKYSTEEKYGFLTPEWQDQFHDYDHLWFFRANWNNDLDPITQAQLLDLKTYLPNDLLPKVDLTSMSASLEVRPPFLDHKLVETIFSIAPRQRWIPGEMKSLLKKSVANMLPDATLKAKKIGFTVPKSNSSQLLTTLQSEYQDEIRNDKSGIFRQNSRIETNRQHLPWDLFAMKMWLSQH